MYRRESDAWASLLYRTCCRQQPTNFITSQLSQCFLRLLTGLRQGQACNNIDRGHVLLCSALWSGLCERRSMVVSSRRLKRPATVQPRTPSSSTYILVSIRMLYED